MNLLSTGIFLSLMFLGFYLIFREDIITERKKVSILLFKVVAPSIVFFSIWVNFNLFLVTEANSIKEAETLRREVKFNLRVGADSILEVASVKEDLPVPSSFYTVYVETENKEFMRTQIPADETVIKRGKYQKPFLATTYGVPDFGWFNRFMVVKPSVTERTEVLRRYLCVPENTIIR